MSCYLTVLRWRAQTRPEANWIVWIVFRIDRRKEMLAVQGQREEQQRKRCKHDNLRHRYRAVSQRQIRLISMHVDVMNMNIVDAGKPALIRQMQMGAAKRGDNERENSDDDK